MLTGGNQGGLSVPLPVGCSMSWISTPERWARLVAARARPPWLMNRLAIFGHSGDPSPVLPG